MSMSSSILSTLNSLRSSPSSRKSKISYEPLQHRQIRILTLHPGAEADPVRCDLEHASLDNSTLDYIALSWTWGKNSAKFENISVNETPQSASPNLYEVLISIRLPNQAQRFWVDALCINQSDDDEKSVQVPLMTDIYVRAKHVLVWLGLSSETTEFAMDCILQENRAQFTTAKFARGILEILLRPWFTRVWVVQEFALNEVPPLLVCGAGHAVPWDAFHEAFSSMALFVQEAPKYQEIWGKDTIYGAEAIRLLVRWANSKKAPCAWSFRNNYVLQRRFIHEMQRGNLASTLEGLKYLSVTDSRDIIYGALGLVDQEYRDQLLQFCPVDYTKSIGQVHIEVTSYLLRVEKDPRIYAEYKVAQGEQASRPSWVPNFSRPYSNPSMLVDTHANNRMLDQIQITNHNQRLIVRGIDLGHVQQVIGPISKLDDLMTQGADFPTHLYPWASILYSTYRLFFSNLDVSFSGTKTLAHIDHVNRIFYRNLCDIEALLENTMLKNNTTLPEPLWKTFLLVAASNEEFKDQEACQHAYDDLLSQARRWALVHILHYSHHYVTDIMRFLSGRCFFLCTNGWYGIAEDGLRNGDQLALLFPPRYWPFILRPKGDYFQIVGVAYVPPPMRDAALHRLEEKQDTVRWFTLV